ncbi:MAG: hypothetical protein JNJ49_02535, partial [Bdellovibrionaceae bacterium]|nr:hypothetical protein [Pseudobdellovibrionaceae bacterium]
SLSQLSSDFVAKDLTDKKAKQYEQGGYDTLTAYPEGSDPFGEDGYRETPLSRQISITPKDPKLTSFSEMRVFLQKVNGYETVAGYSIVGDTGNPDELNRVILLDTKSCKVRLAHNYYRSGTGTVSRGWVKVNKAICEKVKTAMPTISKAVDEKDASTFRKYLPEPAVTETDRLAYNDTIRLCEFLIPGLVRATSGANRSTAR